MAVTLKEQTGASVTTPASNEDSIYFDSSSGAMKFKDDTGTSFTLPTTSGKLSQFAATTSAELAGVISDETGSGALVFGTSPTLSSPVVGTQSYGDSSTKGASTAFVQAAVATVIDDGNSGTADTIDFSAGNVHKSTLTGNVTYTFTAPPNGSVVILKVIQGSGPYTVTWPAAVHWPSGTAPTLTTTDGKVDNFVFLYLDSTYYAVISGQNYTA